MEGWGEKAYNCNWITIKILKKDKTLDNSRTKSTPHNYNKCNEQTHHFRDKNAHIPAKKTCCLQEKHLKSKTEIENHSPKTKINQKKIIIFESEKQILKKK